MPKCPKCGKEVKYIASADGAGVYITGTEESRLINKLGRVITGYALHICENGKKEPCITRHSPNENAP